MGKQFLRWKGPILDMSGYASAGRGYLVAAEAAGIVVQARDRSRSLNLQNKGIDQPILDMYDRLMKNDVPADSPTLQHQVPPCFTLDKTSKKALAYTIFEMAGIPTGWVQPCNAMDEIWTGSEYSKQAFIRSGVTVPIHILPHAIDVDAFKSAKPWQIENRRSFAFLSVFDFTSRKGWKDLLRAYWHAFGPKDDVCLILKVFFNSFSEECRADIIRRIVKYRMEMRIDESAPILVYGHEVPNADMPGLYKAADCYVGVSREGFGLSYAEAMAAGIACIGPEVGGTREFMSPDNSLLVKYLGEEPVSRELVLMNPDFEGLSWAKHSWEHLAEIMRNVVSDTTGRKKIAEKGAEHIRKELKYEAIGLRMSSLLGE